MISAVCVLYAIPFAHTQIVRDTIWDGFSCPVEWNIGTEINGGYVSSGAYLRGDNPENKTVNSTAGIDLRLGFTFDGKTYQERVYPGIYQGVGVGVSSFMPSNLLGNTATAYVYQGAPIVKFRRGLTLNYEWKFGMAAGWSHDAEEYQINAAVSTPVTALLGVGLKMQWEANERVRFWAGIDARHYSNGNTSFPNKGVNSLGAYVGLSYVLTPRYRNFYDDDTVYAAKEALDMHVDHDHYWMWDIMGYGAWRKRVVSMDALQQVCPGRFAVAGLQVSGLRHLCRWVAAGPSLNLQWDESGSLAEYWVDGTYGDDIKFYRPPFGKQIKVGLSAHAELTTTIFHVNAGLGYDILNPRGDKRFYQSLALKTFIPGSQGLYLNVGYRLGDFSTPQNLMLGLGLQW